VNSTSTLCELNDFAVLRGPLRCLLLGSMVLVVWLGCSTGRSQTMSVLDVSAGDDIKWLRVIVKNGGEHILENPRVVADSLIGDEWPLNDPKGIDRQFKRYDLQGYPHRVAVHTNDVRTLTVDDDGGAKAILMGLGIVAGVLVIVAVVAVIGLGYAAGRAY